MAFTGMFRRLHDNRQRVMRAGREALWIGVGQLVAAVGGLVAIRYLTGELSPAVYGELALGITIATLAQQMMTFPLTGGYLRVYSTAIESHKLKSYLRAVMRLTAVSTVTLLSVCLFAMVVLSAVGLGDWVTIVAATVVYSILVSFESTLESIQNAARQRRIVAWHQGLGAWLRIFGALLFIALFGASAAAAIAGYAAATAVVLFSQIAFFSRCILPQRDRNEVACPIDVQLIQSQIVKFAAPFAAWGAFTWTQLIGDRWAIAVNESTASVGLYSVLNQLGYYPMTLFAGMMLGLTAPVLFARAGSGGDPIRNSRATMLLIWITGGMLATTAVATIGAGVLHDRLFLVFAAPEYGSVSHLLPWMVLAGGLFACGQVISLMPMISMRTDLLMVPKIVSALMCVSLYFLGANIFGVKGVVAANVVFGVTYLVWMGLVALRWSRPDPRTAN